MWLHSILTSVLEGGAWLSLQSGHYPPGGRALSDNSTEDRVGPNAGLDIWKKGQFLAMPATESVSFSFPSRNLVTIPVF